MPRMCDGSHTSRGHRPKKRSGLVALDEQQVTDDVFAKMSEKKARLETGEKCPYNGPRCGTNTNTEFIGAKWNLNNHPLQGWGDAA